MQVVLYRNGGGFARPFRKKISPPPGAGMPGAKIRVRLSKKSRPADMCGWTGHLQGNLALRVCEPPCGECAVQRQILSPGGYQGEGISVPRLRAEMGSPWSVSLFDTLYHFFSQISSRMAFMAVERGRAASSTRVMARSGTGSSSGTQNSSPRAMRGAASSLG